MCKHEVDVRTTHFVCEQLDGEIVLAAQCKLCGEMGYTQIKREFDFGEEDPGANIPDPEEVDTRECDEDSFYRNEERLNELGFYQNGYGDSP
jgi:hypothetical protein